MKNKTYFLVIGLLFISKNVFAQMINGCAFLQQNRIEVGIANNGSYGTPEDAPTGYHPNNNPLFVSTFNPSTGTFLSRPNALGFVADYDTNGWAVGTPPYFGDYFLPGNPQEGWAVEVDGVRSNAYSSIYQTNLSTGFEGTLGGVNQTISTSGGITNSVWHGSMGNLGIQQTTTLEQNKLYLIGHVKFYNNGPTPLNNVYYMRTVDPDNDVSVSGNFNTKNVITHQLPNAGNKTLVSATAIVDTLAYLGLGTIDCRSKVFIVNNFSLFPPSIPDSLADFYNGHSDLLYNGMLQSDVGIGIVYQLGNILPGDSAELYYTYILNENSLDEALDEIKAKVLFNGSLIQSGDTIYACANSVVPLAMNNSLLGTTYTWSSTAPLSNTTGNSTNVSVGTTPVTVNIISSGICVDTTSMVIAQTDSLFTTIHAVTCNGTPYVFNGITYTASGIYHETISTFSGCDSIITLHLLIDTPNIHSITASLCNHPLGYYFNSNILTIPGIYYDTLLNSVGCDSLIMLDLLPGPPSVTNIIDSVCYGTTYIFNGMNLSASGTYFDTLINIAGCDSLIILQLTVKPTNTSPIYQNITICGDQVPFLWNGLIITTSGWYYSIVPGTPNCQATYLNVGFTLPLNPILSVNAGIITCSNVTNVTYNWMFNGVNMGITDSFTSLAGNGTYIVEVTDISGCSYYDTLYYFPTGVENAQYNNTEWILFPNPSQNEIEIKMNIKENAEIAISMFDITGRQMMKPLHYTQHHPGEFKQKISLHELQLSSGTYYVVLHVNGRQYKKKLAYMKE